MATQTPGPDGPSDGQGDQSKDVELLRVMVVREGRLVNAQWAIHPQLKVDLKPEELKEVADLMTQITGIVGKRFAKILSEVEPDKPGTA